MRTDGESADRSQPSVAAARDAAHRRLRRLKTSTVTASAAALGAFTWQAAASSRADGAEQALIQVPQPHVDRQQQPAPPPLQRRLVRRVSSRQTVVVHVPTGPATAAPNAHHTAAVDSAPSQQTGDGFVYPTSAPS